MGRSTESRANFCGIIRSLLCIYFLTAPSAAQEWAKGRLENSPRHLEYATVKAGDRPVDCFIAYPEIATKAPAVVVIHDIYGFSEWIRGVADQLAEAGCIAIVPDLVSGTGPDGGGTDSFKSVDEVRRAVSKLKPEQVTSDLNAAAEYVAKLPAASGKVAVAGFCWGGGQSLRYATENDRLAAAYVFYGYQPVDDKAARRIKCPVYGFYAENDARINESIPGLTKLMSAVDKKFEPVSYKGAGHGFMRHGEDPAGNEANKRARDDAWVRWKKLLKNM